MRWKDFNEWKTQVISFLINIINNPDVSEAMRLDARELLEFMKPRKRRDLGSLMLKLQKFADKHGIDLSEIMPKPEEVKAFWEEGE